MLIIRTSSQFNPQTFEKDVEFALACMRRESNKVGFVPAAGIRERAMRGMLVIAVQGGERVGYLFASINTRRKVTTIAQTVVVEAHRRCGVGRAMVNHLRQSHPSHLIKLGCRDDLDANEFWAAIGGQKKGARPGGRARGKILRLYEFDPIKQQLALHRR